MPETAHRSAAVPLSILACVALAASPVVARAEPVTLRLASVAPDGTGWARELKALARDIAGQSKMGTRVKWYLGGVAGDDLIAAERIQRNQLDGVASGGMFCDRLSPTMHAMHMLVETRAEALFLANRLRKDIDEEMKRGGFVYLGSTALGPEVVFSREPVRSLEDLRRYKLWVWDLDDGARTLYPAMGVKTVPLPVTDAYKAYEERQTDGVIGIPTAALAFQWSAQTRYVTDLPMGFITGCIIVAQRAFDQIPIEDRSLVREAGVKMTKRMDDMATRQDEALLNGGLFARQGLRPVPVSAELRKSYETTAREVFGRLGNKVVPGPQLATVQRALDEFRKAK